MHFDIFWEEHVQDLMLALLRQLGTGKNPALETLPREVLHVLIVILQSSKGGKLPNEIPAQIARFVSKNSQKIVRIVATEGYMPPPQFNPCIRAQHKLMSKRARLWHTDTKPLMKGEVQKLERTWAGLPAVHDLRVFQNGSVVWEAQQEAIALLNDNGDYQTLRSLR